MKRQLPNSIKFLLFAKLGLFIGVGIFIFGIYVSVGGIDVEKVYYQYLLLNDNKTIDGVVLDVWERDWDDLDRATAYGYDYYFIHPDLGEIKNTSFGKHRRALYKKGEPATVEYEQGFPYANKLKKLDHSKKGFSVLWYLSIPFVGVIFMLVSMNSTANKIKLLQQGKFTWGTLVRTERGIMDSDEHSSYVLIYQYKDDNGKKHEGRYNTKAPGDFDKKELIVYNIKKPWRILVLYDLDKSITEYIDDNWEEVKRL